MTTIAERTGGAPISWGVCEAPGWGHELPADLVLREMRELGLRATELGPTGYLGTDPADVRARLERRGLRLIGGFLPVPMHVSTAADIAEATEAIQTLAAAGAEVVVLAARSADGSYDHKVPLGDDDWTALLATLGRLQRIAAEHGLTPTLHPHVGTAIEDRAAVLRLLDSSDVLLCLDTGHLLIGGMDPLELVGLAANRIAHVHLKDVRTSVAAVVAAGDTSYIEAVRAGLYTPLGGGDLDIAAIVRALETAGYRGWYVLEQDAALHGPPGPGGGPIHDVRRSIDFLSTLARAEVAR
ncbi:TIM barrel protein [Micromonospora sp. CA-263727]|uniref:TIM barrel protein n=1 Tax=Micromonospora sp. CA-263727 TaxID=3239967 RepID=UPI003D94D590